MKTQNDNTLHPPSVASLICLAEITSAHGLKGAVKLKTFTALPTDLAAYKQLQDQTGRFFTLRILSVTSPSSVIVSLKGIADRTQAEKLRGTRLYVDRAGLPPLEEEEFYYSDLTGMTVITTTHQLIGIVDSVQDYGAGAILEIKDATGSFYSTPFTKEAVPHVNLDTRQLTVDAAFLLNNKA